MVVLTTKILLIVVCLFSVACKELDLSSNESRLKYARAASADRSDKDIQVPKALAQTLEKRFLWHYREINPESERSDAEVLSDIPRRFLGFDVYLLPVRNNLALENSVHFAFPRGGGVIDLAKHIVGNRGTFDLLIRINEEDSGIDSFDLRTLKVYFVSNSLRRTIGKEEFGSGCNKYMEVTDYFKSDISGRGLRLNATDARYISVVAGTFYFAVYREGALHLASSTFEDSRWPKLHCLI